MKSLALTLLVLLAACAHDEKPAQTSPDVSADPTIPPVASATPDVDAGHSACDAVRCRGGMICKMINGTPTCVAKD